MYEGVTIGTENSCCPCPSLLFFQSAAIKLLYLAAKLCQCVMAVEEILWHKNVAVWSPEAGLVTLFKDHNCVPYVAV